MKTLKKIILSFLLSNLIILPAIGLAADNNGDGYDDVTGAYIGSSSSGGTGLVNISDIKNAASKQKADENSLNNAADKILTYVIIALSILAVFYIVMAGYKFVTANGDGEKVEEARKDIMFAAIGIIIALLAKGIVALVISALK